MHQKSGHNLEFHAVFDTKWYSLGPKLGLPVLRCGWSAEAKRTCQVSPEEWRSSQSCRTSSKSKDPMASEALTCATVYAAHVMLNGHINTPANPNWRLTKTSLLIWHQSSITSTWTHSGRRKCTWTLHGNTISPTNSDSPCPLVTTLIGWMRRVEQKRDSSMNPLLLELEPTNVPIQ